MELTGTYTLKAPIDTVWTALNDPAVLAASIPGCQNLEATGKNAFSALVGVKVGPITANFRGQVTLTDIDAPYSYTIVGEGSGGGAGFGKGLAHIRLEEDSTGTRLSYTAEVQTGGKVASVGARLLKNVAQKNADAFFDALQKNIDSPAGPAHRPALQTIPAATGRLPMIDRVAWLVTGAALATAIIFILQRGT